MDESFSDMSGPFPKPIYTINGISQADSVGNINFLGNAGVTIVPGTDNTITLSGLGGASVPAPIEHGQIPIGSADGTFTTTTLTAGSGISITNDHGMINLSLAGASIPVPTEHGQIPIGSADGTFTTTTLTAGSRISITDNPGSITISSPVTPLAQTSLRFISSTTAPPTFSFPGVTVPDRNLFPIGWTAEAANPTSRLDFSAFTTIIPTMNITVGTQNITFTQAGTYLIQLSSCLSGSATNLPIMQLVLNSKNVLFATTATYLTAGGTSLNLSYLASFAVGDVIDFRIGNDNSSNFGFTTINVLVAQLPTST